jgi:hypothetical protein
MVPGSVNSSASYALENSALATVQGARGVVRETNESRNGQVSSCPRAQSVMPAAPQPLLHARPLSLREPRTWAEGHCSDSLTRSHNVEAISILYAV